MTAETRKKKGAGANVALGVWGPRGFRELAKVCRTMPLANVFALVSDCDKVHVDPNSLREVDNHPSVTVVTVNKLRCRTSRSLAKELSGTFKGHIIPGRNGKQHLSHQREDIFINVSP